MISKSRSLLLAATLFAAPLGTVMAQQNNPAGNMGSNKSATAAPGTADSKAASGMNTADSGRITSNYQSSTRITTPGATGKTVVPGSTSSQAGAAAGTVQQKTGATGAK